MFLPDDLRESTSRYRDSYVGYKDGDNILPAMVHEFRNIDGTTIMLGIDASSRREITIPIDRVVWEHPHLGAINVDGHVLYSYKIPNRQYRRGISRRNVSVSYPLLAEDRALGRSIRPALDTRKVISEIFNPSYPSVEEALQSVEKMKTTACAFNNRFFFGVSRHHENIGVYYKNSRIGYINSDRHAVLYHKYNAVYEELSQYINCIKGEK